jgi:pyruvate,water dikinase
MAAGVVTDAGGPFAHTAVVARDYGIPAIVGTTDATRRITTGTRITIDAANGTVVAVQGTV